MDTGDLYDVQFEPLPGTDDQLILRMQRQKVLVFPESVSEDHWIRSQLAGELTVLVHSGALSLTAGAAALFAACLFQ